ncbi:MAG TPA: hypothetical protein VNN98_05480 [Rhizomicrobium sp.]|nr:hypothetical protein [Rhizomicrobium sp.]
MDRCFFFAAMSCALLSQSAFADTRDDVMAGMQRCRAIQDDRAWLDCTYGAEQPMRGKLGLPPAPEFQQRLVPPPPTSVDAGARKALPSVPPHRSASFLQILTGSAAPLTVSTLASVQYDSQGAFILTLQNGQVWYQVDVEGGQKARLKLGARTTVTPGALGSYDLKTDGSPHVYKVERKA